MTRYFGNRSAALRALAGIAILLGLAGCSPSEILKVENPDVIDPGDVATPGGVSALHAGALGEFSLAYVGDNGGTEGMVLVSGSMADELGNSETFPTRKEYDQRTIDIRNSTLSAVFRRIQRARRLTEKSAETIAQFVDPAADPRVGELHNLAGLIYLMFAENYCSGVPISEANDDGSLSFGPPQTTAQLIDQAIGQFDQALAAGANATVTNMGKVLKGRALLYSGDAAGAAAAVAGVPTGFAYTTTHTIALGRQQNGLFVFINQNERFSVGNLDGGNGIDFRDAMDPRVPWIRTGGNDVGFDNATPQFDQGKFFDETAPAPVATGIEARLIEAENLLQTGDVPGWLGILNDLRADTDLLPAKFPATFPATSPFPPLEPLADPGTQVAREDLMFRERAFWLYLSGHRLADLRRLVRHYGRSADAVFPGGGGAPYVINGNNKGGVFGVDVNLPIPFDEQNNPEFTECIDRNP